MTPNPAVQHLGLPRNSAAGQECQVASLSRACLLAQASAEAHVPLPGQLPRRGGLPLPPSPNCVRGISPRGHDATQWYQGAVAEQQAGAETQHCRGRPLAAHRHGSFANELRLGAAQTRFCSAAAVLHVRRVLAANGLLFCSGFVSYYKSECNGRPLEGCQTLCTATQRNSCAMGRGRVHCSATDCRKKRQWECRGVWTVRMPRQDSSRQLGITVDQGITPSLSETGG